MAKRLVDRMANQLDLMMTICHESSHTIYSLLRLMKVDSVCVYEDKQVKRIHGSTLYHNICELDKIEDQELLITLLQADIGMSWAGLIGEKLLFSSLSGSSRTPNFISAGSFEDNQSARQLIKRYNLAPPGQKRAAYKQKLMRQVRQDLELRWSDVVLISHALFKKHKLTFDDLLKLLTKKSADKQFWKDQFNKIRLLHNNDQITEGEIKHYLTHSI